MSTNISNELKIFKSDPLPSTIEGKLERAQLHKEEGNNFFKKGDFKKAVCLYSKAVAYTSGLPGSKRSLGEADIVKQFSNNERTIELTEDQDNLAQEIEKLCHQNIAACYLKLQNPSKVIAHCNKALKLDKNSWKAMLRKAEAYILTKSPDDAKKLLIEASKLCQGNEAALNSIKNELLKVDKLYKKFETAEKKLAAKMFGGTEAVFTSEKQENTTKAFEKTNTKGQYNKLVFEPAASSSGAI